MLIATKELWDSWSVEDTDGGRWWPNEEGERLIQERGDDEAAAISVCDEFPLLGEWHS